MFEVKDDSLPMADSPVSMMVADWPSRNQTDREIIFLGGGRD